MRITIIVLLFTSVSLPNLAHPTAEAALCPNSTAGLVSQYVPHLVESYKARISPNDHFNSRGQRLTKPAEIIRQDRANFHEFGKADDEDESDNFFASKTNREILQKLLEQGHTTNSAYNTIVNGNPLIEVEIYETPSRTLFVNVTILRK